MTAANDLRTMRREQVLRWIAAGNMSVKEWYKLNHKHPQLFIYGWVDLRQKSQRASRHL